jgi:hypothetical protein
MIVIFFGAYRADSDHLIKDCLKKYRHIARGVGKDDAIRQIANVKDDEIIVLRKGKPHFENIDVKFSLSHSRGVYAAAFSEREVGVDIEAVRRPPQRVAALIDAKAEDFFLRWTCLEALAKFSGEGLRFFSGGKEQIARRERQLKEAGIIVRNFPIVSGFAAAVAGTFGEIILVKN